MSFVFTPAPTVGAPLLDESARFPVRRIFCVGRNYADHAREMGAVDQASGSEPPFFFMKPADALVSGAGELRVRYPLLTENLHHEVELVVALGGTAFAGHANENLTVDEAKARIFAYGVGLDLTRRDLQARAKDKGHPWDMSKGFDQSAVLGPLVRASQIGDLTHGRIGLNVNGVLRQSGDLNQMAWGVPEVLANLSRFVALAPGDLVYTGTPAGVGPVERGDVLYGEVAGLPPVIARFV